MACNCPSWEHCQGRAQCGLGEPIIELQSKDIIYDNWNQFVVANDTDEDLQTQDEFLETYAHIVKRSEVN